MALTTQQARNAYPEFIVGGVDRYWNVVGDLKCDWSTAKRVEFLAGPPDYGSGTTVSLRVHPACEEAFRALASVLRYHNYAFGENAGGTVSCRKITGGPKTSGHAHGFALDINPSKNPYGSSKPDELDDAQWERLIRDIKAIRTNNGKPVFQGGGDWSIDDDMHFEPTNCTRADLSTGMNWDTVVGGRGDTIEGYDDMLGIRVGKTGDAR